MVQRRPGMKPGPKPGSNIIARDDAGRIVGTRGLTVQQVEYVNSVVLSGFDSVDAARAAGYADPPQAAYHLRRHGGVQAAIRAGVAQRIAQGAGLAWNVAQGLLADAATNPRLRWDIAKWTLEVTGHVAPKPKDDAPKEEKPLETMTISELEAFIRRGEEAARMARQPILDNEPIAPSVAPSNTQAIDIEGEGVP